MGPLSVHYDDSEKDRLWTHRLHEDVVLTDRQNFFLVAQSLLIVAYADLLNGGEDLAAVVLAIAGLLLTAAWFRVNHRQRTIVRYVQERAVGALREFADTYRDRPRAKIDSTTVLTIIVPGLLGAVWVALLYIALF